VDVNIIGHGIDLVDIAEMRRWIEDPRGPLIPRCFVQEELDEIGTISHRPIRGYTPVGSSHMSHRVNQAETVSIVCFRTSSS
jgi:phosphopantetheinyl transferase (holo-ACP synthase)